MSFPAYEFYKDTGVDWLPQVPTTWEVRTLSSLTNKITNGYVGPTRGILVDEGVRYLQSLHIKQNEIRFHTPYYVTEEWSNEHEKSILEAGDVLVVQTGDIGQVAVVPEAFAGCNCHALIILTPHREQVSGEWMAWVLNSDYGFHSLMSIKTGALHPHLNCSNVKYLKIPVPDIDEQKAISSFLDVETSKIDSLVSEQRRLIELLKEKRQAVISHAVTKGLNPNAPMKPSGIQWLGDVPQHWSVTAIKHMCRDITDGAHVSPETENGVYCFVSTRDVSDDGIDFENCLRTSDASYEYLLRTGCKPFAGDVLFSKDGTIGRTVVVHEDRDFVVASSLIILRPFNGKLDSTYLHHLCQSNIVKNQVERFVRGAGLPRLSITNLCKVIGCFPPRDEQREIGYYLNQEVETFSQLQAEAERAIELLQERRTALISAAVTGKIDVRGFANKEAVV
ncbi:restriction endonuclease subunit S [Rhodopirellula europaea]|uniref:restriction endonuclease subunit S n=1 Tax=Rhodopirellula europaea TaxID=1263866 RepID=UPI003D291105|tara:strand:- start:8673 stop:10022 length:1350 start_codon:yes stop_codon:yes gene_type:complete